MVRWSAFGRLWQGRIVDASERLLKQWDQVAQALHTFHDASQLRLSHIIQVSAQQTISEAQGAVRDALPRPAVPARPTRHDLIQGLTDRGLQLMEQLSSTEVLDDFSARLRSAARSLASPDRSVCVLLLLSALRGTMVGERSHVVGRVGGRVRRTRPAPRRPASGTGLPASSSSTRALARCLCRGT